MSHPRTVRDRPPTPPASRRLRRGLALPLVFAATACIPDNPAPPRADDPDTTAAAHPDSSTATRPDATAATPAPPPTPDTTPPTPPPVLDLVTTHFIASMPIGCVDRPQTIPANRSGYLIDVTYSRRPGFERDRAFYGCWDWHSAVNSTWTLVMIMKEVPDFPLSPLIREKLEFHINEGTMAGELAYLTENPSFERPYGWVWLLLLHAELEAWGDPDAAEWSGYMDPLADLLDQRLSEYIEELEEPVRSGTHRNTAFAISMGLRAAEMARRPRLERILRSAATRLFAGDRDCPVEEEPGPSDFLSPCLEVAALMAELMDRGDYVRWLDALLPPVDSEKFASLRRSSLSDSTPGLPARISSEGLPPQMAEALSALMSAARVAADSVRRAMADSAGRGDSTAIPSSLARVSPAARSHLIGLSFTRADAMLRIAEALPAGDPRVARLRELAARHGNTGFETILDADYYGSHWIGSFALKYLVESGKVVVP